MADVTQSFSQLLLTYGPGAMLDMPDHAVVVSGLQGWRYGANWQPIEEKRLIPLLREQLGLGVEFEGLRPPPEFDEERRDQKGPGVDVYMFPTWFTVDEGAASAQTKPNSETPQSSGHEVTRRRMVEFEHLTVSKTGKLSYVSNGKKLDVNPVRFVGACPKGHLQDIDWRALVHRRSADRNCRRSLYWIERGVSSDPSDIAVRCDCGVQVTLADLYKPKFMGTCHAHSPWLQPRRLSSETCDQDLRLLPRSATNTYFAQTVTVISLTPSDDRLRQIIEEHRTTIEPIIQFPNVIEILRSLPMTRGAFEQFSDDEVRHALDDSASSDEATSTNPRVAEFDVLASGQPVIGRDHPDSFLFAETLERNTLKLTSLWDNFLKGVVRVGRLREVTCLYGFTRLEPPPTSAESDLDEIQLAVDGAPLAREIKWLPAVEQFGEGIFLHIDPDYIQNWLPRVTEEANLLKRAEVLDAMRFNRSPKHLGIAYWALHSLSHALMSEFALECGYPISSLKERIYASASEVAPRYGILIYTSTPGGQGTLGGLSGMAERVVEFLDRAVERLPLCSNDPVCSEHQPGNDLDDRPLHGAACHGCLLVPETSCELRNTRLDRGLLVTTLVKSGQMLFSL